MQQSRRRITHAPPSGDSKVEQHHAPQAETSAIVNRHKPGQFIGDPRATRQPMFMDVPSETFHESLNRVMDVQNQFSQLPARIRGMFGNNPYQLLRFLEVPENRPKALKLGLVVPTEDEAVFLATEAAKARRGEQIDLIREAMRPGPPERAASGGEPQNAPKQPPLPDGD